MQNLTWKFILLYLTNEKCGIMEKGALNLLDEQFTNLIGSEHLDFSNLNINQRIPFLKSNFEYSIEFNSKWNGNVMTDTPVHSP